MRVSTLQLFLRSLGAATSAGESSSALPADLEEVSVGLQPFAPLDFTQFAAFLRQAKQYRDSGAVAVPSAASLGAEKVQASLHGAASLADKLSSGGSVDAQQVTADREKAREELEQALARFLKPLAIKVSLKGDAKGFRSALQRARTQGLAARLRAVLHGVTDEASLNTTERKDQLRAVVDPLQPADLKAVATELGAPASDRSKESLLASIVARVTGVNPAARKPAQASRGHAVDKAAVQQQALKLKGLLEKSRGPSGLSRAELEAAMSELGGSGVAELQAIAKELGLEKVGKVKKGILNRIREKLQEIEHARESIRV
jgi:hypothetical protein